jgi:hypothetical protein
MPNLKCTVCGNEFHVPKCRESTAKYCGTECKIKALSIKNIGNEYSKGRKAPWLTEINNMPGRNAEVSRKTAQKRADKLRGTGSKDNYVKRNCKHEHRLVMEKHLGRKLTSNEVVHHIDGDKWNNDISNLIVMTRQEHIAVHREQMVIARKVGDAV